MMCPEHHDTQGKSNSQKDSSKCLCAKYIQTYLEECESKNESKIEEADECAKEINEGSETLEAETNES